MIITEAKPLTEVLDAIEGCQNIAVLGCGRCATSCGTGGKKQVTEMKKKLREKGFKVVYTDVIEAQCDERLARKSIREMPKVDAIVSMACGSGAQAVADLSGVHVVPSNNTMFLGVVKRIGEYEERCTLCGDCMLADTMGVCLNTRCSKSLLTEPCGASNGKTCEADCERECAWGIVVKRLRGKDKLSDIGKINRARRVYELSRPRRIKR
ncbi:MAG TPA: 5,10-methylenetetrahydrofolate reductase [Candidatus Altiarchaeales archaeon]|nr:5,10-methylenetetrahydrofolate reductase [Candidatus Altiarchaeales archaeon]